MQFLVLSYDSIEFQREIGSQLLVLLLYPCPKLLEQPILHLYLFLKAKNLFLLLIILGYSYRYPQNLIVLLPQQLVDVLVRCPQLLDITLEIKLQPLQGFDAISILSELQLVLFHPALNFLNLFVVFGKQQLFLSSLLIHHLLQLNLFGQKDLELTLEHKPLSLLSLKLTFQSQSLLLRQGFEFVEAFVLSHQRTDLVVSFCQFILQSLSSLDQRVDSDVLVQHLLVLARQRKVICLVGRELHLPAGQLYDFVSQVLYFVVAIGELLGLGEQECWGLEGGRGGWVGELKGELELPSNITQSYLFVEAGRIVVDIGHLNLQQSNNITQQGLRSQ